MCCEFILNNNIPENQKVVIIVTGKQNESQWQTKNLISGRRGLSPLLIY